MGQRLIGRLLYGSRKKEALIADDRLNALISCLVQSLGVQYEVVGAFSALDYNFPHEVVVVCRSELSEVLLAESSSHTPVQQGLHHLVLEQVHL